ncbi:MAG: deoxyribodipyrimidine photo-lyase/cryptochrome family protein [Thioalkalivibrionaceae bacterium]
MPQRDRHEKAVRVVWFKRDLRVFDHAPLCAAARALRESAGQAQPGLVMPMYIIEPSLWRQPDASLRQWRFVRDSLIDLDAALRALGTRLWVMLGEAPEVFSAVAALRGQGLWRLVGVDAHEETGNAWSFARDRAVAKALRATQADFREAPTPGVVRRLRERRGWATQWEAAMRQPPLPPVSFGPPRDVESDDSRVNGRPATGQDGRLAAQSGHGADQLALEAHLATALNDSFEAFARRAGGEIPRLLSAAEWHRFDPAGHDDFELPDWAGHRSTTEPPHVAADGRSHVVDWWAPQRGGRRAAIVVLESFLAAAPSEPQPSVSANRCTSGGGVRAARIQCYLASLSRPARAFENSSRLSAYLSWGCLSLREVTLAHRAQAQRLGVPWRPGMLAAPRNRSNSRKPASTAQADLFGTIADTAATAWETPRPSTRNAADRAIDRSLDLARQYSAFDERLHWRSHFVQKLESDMALEQRNLLSAVDGLREPHFDEQRFKAWCEGRTGYPMIDACMRALRQTGWLNFRMRAMLVSFAAYDLWLHWQKPAWFLARLFTDYEPGIHYSQMQMQSGTTGINALRIYDPLKQSRDQDPDGRFIRRFVPELRALNGDQIHCPWVVPAADLERANIVLGRDYPWPLVDHLTAAQTARRAIEARRRADGARQEAHAVFERHGSRRPKALRSWRSGPRS